MSQPTVGQLDPSLAKRLGLDDGQSIELGLEVDRWEGRIFPVTFTTPPPRADGKRDPIAYLPPDYRLFGIIDRAYRDRVAVGESWLVEVLERGGTKFLVPLSRIDLKSFLELQPSLLLVIAEHLARQSPSLAKELGGKLPTPPDPETERKLSEATEGARKMAEQVAQLQRDKAGLETKVDELTAKLREAPKALPEPAHRSPMMSGTNPATPPSPRAVTSVTTSDDDGGSQLVRTSGDVVESTRLIHAAYEVLFTTDLYRLYLRPSSTGTPCRAGRIIIPGLAEVDPTPAPTSYPLSWDPRQAAFSVYLGERVVGARPLV